MEKVSVIIAMYNSEKFIETTLDSIINQTWPDIEIIVVNDGSTDSSRQIIENLDLPNLRLYNNDNRGQCASSNFGVGKSTGDLIKFLDSDDILAPDCIEKMILKWRENPNRLVFGEWHYFVDDIKFLKVNDSVVYKDYENELDWYIDVLNNAEAMLAGWMWLIPRAIWEKSGGWDERLHLMNDFEFSTRLILNSEGIGFASGAIHYYRKGLDTAMTSLLNDEIAFSIYSGVLSAYNNIKYKEDSPRIQKAFADQFQKWIYYFYPLHLTLIDSMENLVKDMGGSALKPSGGKIFNFLIIFLPWKVVKWIQYFLHKSVWKPILKLKKKQKYKKHFNTSY